MTATPTSGVPWTSGTDTMTTDIAARNAAAEAEVDVDANVDAAIAALLDGAPTALDTLNELAAALNDDADYAATITTALAAKASTAAMNTALAAKADDAATTAALATKVTLTGQHAFVGPNGFMAVTGSPNLSSSSGRAPSWRMDTAIDERIGCNFDWPLGWNTFHADLVWFNAGAGSGTAIFELLAYAYSAADLITEALWLQAQPSAATAGAANEITVTRLCTGQAITAGTLHSLVVRKNGGTLANDVGVLGLILTRAS